MKKINSAFLVICLCTALFCSCTEKPAPSAQETGDFLITDINKPEGIVSTQPLQDTENLPTDIASDTKTGNDENASMTVSGEEILRIPYADGVLLESLGAKELSESTAIVQIRIEKELHELLCEMEDFIEKQDGYGYHFDASRLLSTYNASFFEERSLLVLQLTAGSGSIRYRAQGLSYDENTDTLTITVETRIPEVGTDDMASWLLFLPADIDAANAKAIEILLNRIYEGEEDSDGGRNTDVPGDSGNVYFIRISYVDHDEIYRTIPCETIFSNSGATPPVLMRFSSWKSFSAWKEESLLPFENCNGKDSQAMKAATVFDETFFEENSLFILLWNEPSGSFSHRFKGTFRDDTGAVTIEIQTSRPETHTDDMATWLLFLPIKPEYADAESVRILTSIKNTK